MASTMSSTLESYAPRSALVRGVLAFVVCSLLVGCSALAPEPTATPLPTDTPAHTSTPLPTSTPTPTSTPIPTPTPVPTIGPFTDNVYYGEAGNYRQSMSVHLPVDADPPYPTVLLFHGGGGYMGTRTFCGEVGSVLSERGIAAVAATYEMGRKYPKPLEDAFCALAWMHAEAPRYGFDPEHIVVVGLSAGGSLASLLALIDDPQPLLTECAYTIPSDASVAGVVSYAGAYDYERVDDFRTNALKWVNPWHAYRDDHPDSEGHLASPIAYIHRDAPPFLLFHGLDDTGALPDHSRAFETVLAASGVEVELIEVPGVWHYSGGNELLAIEDMQLEEVEAFVKGLD